MPGRNLLKICRPVAEQATFGGCDHNFSCAHHQNHLSTSLLGPNYVMALYLSLSFLHLLLFFKIHFQAYKNCPTEDAAKKLLQDIVVSIKRLKASTSSKDKSLLQRNYNAFFHVDYFRLFTNVFEVLYMCIKGVY